MHCHIHTPSCNEIIIKKKKEAAMRFPKNPLEFLFYLNFIEIITTI